MKFCIDIYEFDHPGVHPIHLEYDSKAERSQPLALSISVSDSLCYDLYGKEFQDFAEMERFRDEAMTELAFLRKHHANVTQALRLVNDELGLLRRRADTDPITRLIEIVELYHKETQVSYTSKLLPRMISAFELRLEIIAVRIGRALKAADGGQPHQIILRHELEKNKQRLNHIVDSSVPMSQSWESAIGV